MRAECAVFFCDLCISSEEISSFQRRDDREIVCEEATMLFSSVKLGFVCVSRTHF